MAEKYTGRVGQTPWETPGYARAFATSALGSFSIQAIAPLQRLNRSSSAWGMNRIRGTRD
jgi:hypothetical protein